MQCTDTTPKNLRLNVFTNYNASVGKFAALCAVYQISYLYILLDMRKSAQTSWCVHQGGRVEKYILYGGLPTTNRFL